MRDNTTAAPAQSSTHTREAGLAMPDLGCLRGVRAASANLAGRAAPGDTGQATATMPYPTRLELSRVR
jgi:hypothetical protein